MAKFIMLGKMMLFKSGLWNSANVQVFAMGKRTSNNDKRKETPQFSEQPEASTIKNGSSQQKAFGHILTLANISPDEIEFLNSDFMCFMKKWDALNPEDKQKREEKAKEDIQKILQKEHSVDKLNQSDVLNLEDKQKREEDKKIIQHWIAKNILKGLNKIKKKLIIDQIFTNIEEELSKFSTNVLQTLCNACLKEHDEGAGEYKKYIDFFINIAILEKDKAYCESFAKTLKKLSQIVLCSSPEKKQEFKERFRDIVISLYDTRTRQKP
jgi:hypothetical protein